MLGQTDWFKLTRILDGNFQKLLNLEAQENQQKNTEINFLLHSTLNELLVID